MGKRAVKWVAAAMLATGAWHSAGYAADLSLAAAVDAAVRNDPVLLALAAQTRADSEALPRARADLLPRVGFSATQSRNNTETRSLGPGSAGLPTITNTYDSSSQALTLYQPLIRARAWVGYFQGEAAVTAADAQYAAGLQQAIDRAIFAYSEKLRLESEVVSARENATALEQRLTSVRLTVGAGQASDVELRGAEAELAQARARVAEAEIDLQSANRELTRLTAMDWSMWVLTGDNGRALAARVRDLIQKKLATDTPLELEAHPDVTARRLRLEIARRETQKRRADHLPTLDLVASYTHGKSASDIVIGRETTTSLVGVQLSLPIYSGGAVNSAVREAAALEDKADMDLRNTRLLVENDRARANAQLRATLTRLAADIDAYDASDIALQRASRGVSAGISSDVEAKTALARKAATAASLVTSVAKAISYYSKARLAYGDLDIGDASDFSRTIVQILGLKGSS